MSNRVSILRPTYTFTDLILHLAHLHGNAGFVATHVFTPFLLQLISREMAVRSPMETFSVSSNSAVCGEKITSCPSSPAHLSAGKPDRNTLRRIDQQPRSIANKGSDERWFDL
jgi:hypothetical protein